MSNSSESSENTNLHMLMLSHILLLVILARRCVWLFLLIIFSSYLVAFVLSAFQDVRYLTPILEQVQREFEIHAELAPVLVSNISHPEKQRVQTRQDTMRK